MPRMKILNSIEQEAFELPPVLNSAERKRHFDFPVAILRITAELRTSANQLSTIVYQPLRKLATSLGFAPRPSGSKPGMLLLHHEAKGLACHP